MTFEQLKKVIKHYKIPNNVVLKSDSGWECWATHMDGVWYNKEQNCIVFTQLEDDERYDEGFKKLKTKFT